MRIDLRHLTLVALFTIAASSVRADGLLRMPAEGEYVVYEMLAVPIDEDEGDQDQALAEMQGTLRVACVGVEQQQEATSRWIEITVDLAGGANPEIHFVFKLLVPDEGLADSEALLPFTRGWVRMGDGDELTEISPDRIGLFHPGFLLMRTVMVSAETTEETASEKSVLIGGEELVLPIAIAGEFATLGQQVDAGAAITHTGEGTWWPHDDHSFVPAADIIWTMQLGAEGTASDSKGIAIQLEATEFGGDAVSELVDSN